MMMKQAMSKAGLDYTIYNAKDGIEAFDLLRGSNGVDPIKPFTSSYFIGCKHAAHEWP